MSNSAVETPTHANAAEVKSRAAPALIAASLGSFLNIATLIIYPFGVVALAIAAEIGASDKAIVALLGPGLLLTALCGPLVGAIVQRFHKPFVAIGASIGAAAGLTLLAFAPGNLTALTITLAIGCLLTTGASPILYSAIVAENFDRRRGLALGVATAFTGVGIAVLPVIYAQLIAQIGWRGTYIAMGAVMLVVAAGMAILLRGVPRPVQMAGAGAKDKEGLRQALRDPVFWTIAIFFLLVATTVNGLPVHLPLILKERGADAATGAASLSVLGIAVILTRPLIGFLIDRISLRLTLLIMLAGPIAGVIVLLSMDGVPAAMLAAAGLGMAVGGEFVALGYMVSRGFPVRNFGVIYGSLGLTLALGQMAGPALISWIAASSGSYSTALVTMVALMVVALALGLTLPERRFRAAAS